MAAKVPSFASVNKMTLDQLNQQIEILGKRINQRMKELRQMEYQESSFSLFRLQKLAAEWTPEEKYQTRYNFSRAKAQTKESGQARVKNLIKALNYQTSTRSGIKEVRQNKKKGFEEKYLKNGQGMTDQQWEKLTGLFNKLRESGIDSGTIIEIFDADETYGIFDTADDLIAYIEEKGQGLYRRQLGAFKRTGYVYRFDEESGKFIHAARKSDYEQMKLPL